MSVLYVREVPDELYGALRRRARERRTSISREAIRLLQSALRTDDPALADLLLEVESHRPRTPRGTPPAAELIRADRDGR